MKAYLINVYIGGNYCLWDKYLVFGDCSRTIKKKFYEHLREETGYLDAEIEIVSVSERIADFSDKGIVCFCCS